MFNGQSRIGRKDARHYGNFSKCAELRTFSGLMKVFTVEVSKNFQNRRQPLSPALKNDRKREIATRNLFPVSLMVGAASVLQPKLL